MKIMSKEVFWVAIGVIISVIIYYRMTRRTLILETIKEYSNIRNKYSNPSDNDIIPEDKRKAYLQEMERFCTGIQLGLYDINTLSKISGHRLIEQYKKYGKVIIEESKMKKDTEADSLYCQYETTIKELQKISGL
ncbi:DUF4760 domain-containing protein [Aminipila terrae]|uniref:DUF4760 domain-containing protein n=1 Tax=Aminipila terrae TaxID=2697030 RepID=A0A6P1MAQ3_9FIRM|nr:hypothetical protein [Aminipila terrae]QHI71759.1 hypothetical protein Ami3637_04585 [Aminipila terrae]